jgi:hypothetical protein
MLKQCFLCSAFYANEVQDARILISTHSTERKTNSLKRGQNVNPIGVRFFSPNTDCCFWQFSPFDTNIEICLRLGDDLFLFQFSNSVYSNMSIYPREKNWILHNRTQLEVMRASAN